MLSTSSSNELQTTLSQNTNTNDKNSVKSLDPKILKLSTTPRRRSMTNIDEKKEKTHQCLKSQITQINTTKTPLNSKKSSNSSSSLITSTPNLGIKYASDGTKYTTTGGKLFRGGSNNNPNLDLLINEKENTLNTLLGCNNPNTISPIIDLPINNISTSPTPTPSSISTSTSISNDKYFSSIAYSTIPFTNSYSPNELTNLDHTPSKIKKRKINETEDDENNNNDRNYSDLSTTSNFSDQKRKRRISC